MRKPYLVFLLFLFVGCTSYSFKHVHINGTGTYIYNNLPITGNAAVDWYSCVGKCVNANSIEVVNDTK